MTEEPAWDHDTNVANRALWPAIVVAEAQPMLATTLGELFDALRLRMVQVASSAELEACLRDDMPLGVLVHLPRDTASPEGHALADALERVARADASLPVMAITDPPAKAVRAAGDLGKRPLVNMVWLPRPPALRMVIEFLFMAERHRGQRRLMTA
jgi:hypothetical protein